MGIRMVAHAIIKFGTDVQKEFFLPRILTGEVFFCQGYSEPEAGSDLAALSMAAVDDGDDLVCTGSKIWTTHAGEANWMFGLVRTSRTAKRQQGITFLLIDMTSPGIQIRPLVMTSGEKIQNQVFFDEVRVPKSNVLGQIDDAATRGRRSRHCATSTTGPARSTPAATKFSGTFSRRRRWGCRWTSI
jgi:alkylation response protein AidB-like acyl-CoA dehydrogenase